jgi:hypothetical protein
VVVVLAGVADGVEDVDEVGVAAGAEAGTAVGVALVAGVELIVDPREKLVVVLLTSLPVAATAGVASVVLATGAGRSSDGGWPLVSV